MKKTFIPGTFIIFILAAALISMSAKVPYAKKLKALFIMIENRHIAEKIISSCQGYNITQNDYAKIYFTDEDEDYISIIKSATDLYYPLLADDFNMKKTVQAIIVVYPDRESIIKNTRESYLNTAMGAYYGGIINILSPRQLYGGANETESKNYFWENGPLIHELSHFLLDKKTDGNYEAWFSEGLALYYEHKYTAFEWRNDLKEKSRGISLSRLRDNFKDIDEPMAYRRAFDIISSIAYRNGEEKIRDIIETLSMNGDIVITNQRIRQAE